MKIASWEFESPPLHLVRKFLQVAEIAQLVEHDLAKVGVASSSLVSRSRLTASAVAGASVLKAR